MIEALEDIARLRPGKNAQIAAKKSVKNTKKEGQKRDELYEREKQRTKSFQHEKKNTEQ